MTRKVVVTSAAKADLTELISRVQQYAPSVAPFVRQEVARILAGIAERPSLYRRIEDNTAPACRDGTVLSSTKYRMRKSSSSRSWTPAKLPLPSVVALGYMSNLQPSHRKPP